MARKVMQCKSAPEIVLQFDGGEEILLRFDIRCLASIQEHKGGFQNFMKKSLSEMAAVIVYGAGKDINKDFTEKKAREIVANMSIDNVTEIINTFQESVGQNVDDDTAKKLLAQFLGAKSK